MGQLAMFSKSLVKASSVIGTKIVNPKGESLGEIKEVVLDPSVGRVAYVVVSLVRSFVMGEKLFAIPFSAFGYNVTKNEYVLDAPKALMEKAPGFDSDHWPTWTDEKWNRDVYGFYNRSPYWE